MSNSSVILDTSPSLHGVLHCVAVCCSVLKCVAVCCSVLQCVAVCCSGLYSFLLQVCTVCCSVFQCVAVRCSVLQCVAVCCSVLQHVAQRCSLQRGVILASSSTNKIFLQVCTRKFCTVLVQYCYLMNILIPRVNWFGVCVYF